MLRDIETLVRIAGRKLNVGLLRRFFHSAGGRMRTTASAPDEHDAVVDDRTTTDPWRDESSIGGGDSAGQGASLRVGGAGARTLIDDETIAFGRCVCGEEPGRPERLQPSWAVVAGWDCVTFDEKERRTRLPSAGETCRIRMTYPFTEQAGHAFWFFVRGDEPGLPEDAGALAGSCLIRARTRSATMEPPSPGSPRGHAVATALVLETIGMDDLRRLPAREGPIFDGWAFYGRPVEQVRNGGFRSKSWSAEGDLGAFAIWHEAEDGTASLLVAGGWDHHESFASAGRRPLSPEERAFLSSKDDG